MTDIQATPNKFTTITYVTKDGEKCTATKNNGVVTVQGDKNGVRQVPVEQFMQEFVENMPKVDLARTPNKDTVQFKGSEEKTLDNNAEKPNHNVRNWAIGIGSGVAALIGLGVAGRKGHLGQGIQKFLGGAEKDAGKLGDDIVSGRKFDISDEEIEQLVRELSNETDPIVESAIVTSGTKAEEAVATTVTKTEEAATGVVKPTETPKPVETKPTEAPKPIETTQKPAEAKPTEAKPAETETIINSRPKSPIPESEMFELPKDLECDPMQVLGGKYLSAVHTKTESLVTVCADNGITRTYVLTPDKKAITRVDEFASGELRPFRQITFQDGKPRSIKDLTVEGDRIRFLPKEKPAQPKTAEASKPAEVKETPAPKPNETVDAKKEEIARRKQIDDDLARQQEEAQKEADRLRREQEEMINNDIINAAVVADLMSGAGKKAAEKAGETASTTTDKLVEQLAKEIDKAAETTVKADIPKAGTVVEEVLPSASKVETTVAESTIESGEKVADDFWEGIQPKEYQPQEDWLNRGISQEADSFHPTEIAETPKTSYFDEVAEYETPRTSLFDDTVDEFGMPKFDSYSDDLASLDSSIDDIGSSTFDDFSSGFDDGFDFM